MTFRAPIFTPYFPPDWTRAVNALSQGLNPNLLGGGKEPFYQTDYPNPRGYPFPVEDRTFLWQGNTLVGGGKEPFYQTDWPNPRGYPFPIDNRTFLGSLPPLFGGGREPFYQTDWPNPRGYPSPPDNLRNWVWQGNALIGGGAPPTVTTFDYPNPRGYGFPTENRTFLSEGNALLLGAGIVQAPLGPYDWPNPRGPVFPTENRTWVWQGNAGIGGGAPPVVVTFDYPNPRGPIFPIENRTWLQPLNLSLLQPFTQTDWPNPRGYPFPAENRSFLWNGTALLPPPAVQAPFSQYDWPNPRGPSFPVENRTFVLEGNALTNVPPPSPPPPPPAAGRVLNKKLKLRRREIVLDNGIRIIADADRADLVEALLDRVAAARATSDPTPEEQKHEPPPIDIGPVSLLADVEPLVPIDAPTIALPQVAISPDVVAEIALQRLAQEAQDAAEQKAREAQAFAETIAAALAAEILDDDEEVAEIVLMLEQMLGQD